MLTSGGYSVRVKLIGEELRAHREAAGLTLRQVDQMAGLNSTKIHRMETGERPQKIEDVATLLAAYGVRGEQRGQLLDLTRDDDRSSLLLRHSATMAQRVATLRFLESRATKLINFECQRIPGLLQTFPYAQELIRIVAKNCSTSGPQPASTARLCFASPAHRTSKRSSWRARRTTSSATGPSCTTSWST